MNEVNVPPAIVGEQRSSIKRYAYLSGASSTWAVPHNMRRTSTTDNPPRPPRSWASPQIRTSSSFVSFASHDAYICPPLTSSVPTPTRSRDKAVPSITRVGCLCTSAHFLPPSVKIPPGLPHRHPRQTRTSSSNHLVGPPALSGLETPSSSASFTLSATSPEQRRHQRTAFRFSPRTFTMSLDLEKHLIFVRETRPLVQSQIPQSRSREY